MKSHHNDYDMDDELREAIEKESLEIAKNNQKRLDNVLKVYPEFKILPKVYLQDFYTKWQNLMIERIDIEPEIISRVLGDRMITYTYTGDFTLEEEYSLLSITETFNYVGNYLVDVLDSENKVMMPLEFEERVQLILLFFTHKAYFEGEKVTDEDILRDLEKYTTDSEEEIKKFKKSGESIEVVLTINSFIEKEKDNRKRYPNISTESLRIISHADVLYDTLHILKNSTTMNYAFDSSIATQRYGTAFETEIRNLFKRYGKSSTGTWASLNSELAQFNIGSLENESVEEVLTEIKNIRNDASHPDGATLDQLDKIYSYVHIQPWLQKIAES